VYFQKEIAVKNGLFIEGNVKDMFLMMKRFVLWNMFQCVE
jgi:hypothetical protein